MSFLSDKVLTCENKIENKGILKTVKNTAERVCNYVAQLVKRSTHVVKRVTQLCIKYSTIQEGHTTIQKKLKCALYPFKL